MRQNRLTAHSLNDREAVMIDTMLEAPAPALILVDDDPAFCEVLGDALARRGLDIFIAHNAEDGLRLAEQHAPGYAVVDLRHFAKTSFESSRALGPIGFIISTSFFLGNLKRFSFVCVVFVAFTPSPLWL